jgi:hypothetical protein
MIGPRGQMIFNKGSRKFMWYQDRVIEVIEDDVEEVDMPTFDVEEEGTSE